jgi:hypothetical protein
MTEHDDVINLLTAATAITPDQLPAFRLAAAIVLARVVRSAPAVQVAWGRPAPVSGTAQV